MKYETGNIWDIESEGICIPTNGVVKKNGFATMGAGLALQAALKYPELPKWLGNRLSDIGNNVRVYPTKECRLIMVPTKNHWKDKSDITLIENSLEELVEIVDFQCIKSVLITKLGCGCGGLDWNQVKPLMEHYLDDRFVLVTPK